MVNRARRRWIHGIFLVALVPIWACPAVSVVDLERRLDIDGDGIRVDVDCDDENPQVGPPEAMYADADADGWGAGSATASCTLLPGWTANPGDCNDNDDAVHPGAREVCNGVDDDCDTADENSDAVDASTWYQDADGDGYGDPSTATRACGPPAEGWVSEGTDCDDQQRATHPGAVETWYDDVDQDCAGDDDWDADGDGHRSAEGGGPDCADANGQVNPDASDACGDGLDNDCDGFETHCALEGHVDLLDADSILEGYVHIARGLGDVDGDGLDDFGLANFDTDNTTSGEGVIYVVYGPQRDSLALEEAAVAIWSGVNAVYMASKLGAGGDLNADGYADILATTQGLSWEIRDNDAILVFGGPVTEGMDIDDAIAFVDFESATETIPWLEGASDATGDGVDDLWTAYEEDGVVSSGRLIAGPVRGQVSIHDPTVILTGDEMASVTGLVTGGDLDGDGVDDVALTRATDSSFPYGTVHVFHGPFGADFRLEDAHATLGGSASDCWSGHEPEFTADLHGDVTGDGQSDLLVGAPYWTPGDGAPGAVYILTETDLSQPTLAASGAILQGAAAPVAIGDVTGDRSSEIVTNPPWGEECDASWEAAALHSGPFDGAVEAGESMLALFCGPMEGYWYGTGPQGIGDADGDGFADLLIGQGDFVYLFYGGPS